MMNGAQYLEFITQQKKELSNLTGDALLPENILHAIELENYQNGIETDWQDLIFRTALTNSHQISVSGGTENTTYMASISRLNQEGVVKDTGIKRTNIALNVTQKLGTWLTIGMGTQAVQKNTEGYKQVSAMPCCNLLMVCYIIKTALCAIIRWMKLYIPTH